MVNQHYLHWRRVSSSSGDWLRPYISVTRLLLACFSSSSCCVAWLSFDSGWLSTRLTLMESWSRVKPWTPIANIWSSSRLDGRICRRLTSPWRCLQLFVNHCRINARKISSLSVSSKYGIVCHRVLLILNHLEIHWIMLISVYNVLNTFIVLFYILFYLVGLAIVFTFTADFNVSCTVWHVSGASRPLSCVNK